MCVISWFYISFGVRKLSLEVGNRFPASRNRLPTPWPPYKMKFWRWESIPILVIGFEDLGFGESIPMAGNQLPGQYIKPVNAFFPSFVTFHSLSTPQTLSLLSKIPFSSFFTSNSNLSFKSTSNYILASSHNIRFFL